MAKNVQKENLEGGGESFLSQDFQNLRVLGKGPNVLGGVEAAGSPQGPVVLCGRDLTDEG